MYKALQDYIATTPFEGLFVNLQTGEWHGGPSAGFEYKSKEEIIALDGGEAAEDKSPTKGAKSKK